MVDLLSSPIRPTIPYGTSFRISQGFFSIYYLLSVSIGHFLGLTCNSEEKSNFAAEDDFLGAVAVEPAHTGRFDSNFSTHIFKY